MQLDNRVIPEVSPLLPANKHERLAIECQRPDLQMPCQPGQKWHCVNDAGRWRKHKCKFQVHLPQKPPSSKKCACFTPAGVVYTRMKVNISKAEEHRRVQRHNRRRTRSVDEEDVKEKLRGGHLDEIENPLKELLDRYPSVAHLGPLNSRKKRDALDHMESVLKDITDELSGLEVRSFKPFNHFFSISSYTN